MKSQGWDPIIGLVPYKKSHQRACSVSCVYTQGHIRTQIHSGHVQAKRRGLRMNPTCKHLDFGFPSLMN